MIQCVFFGKLFFNKIILEFKLKKLLFIIYSIIMSYLYEKQKKKNKILEIKDISWEILTNTNRECEIYNDIFQIYNLICNFSEKVRAENNEESIEKQSENEKLLENIRNHIKGSTRLLNNIGLILIIVPFIITIRICVL